MSRAVRFPPPVLPTLVTPMPSSSSSAYSGSSRSAVLYDSDEDAAGFQLIPSPEHQLSHNPHTTPSPVRPSSSRTSTSTYRPVQTSLFDEEEDLVSPSSSYTLSPSASLDQLIASAPTRHPRPSDSSEDGEAPASRPVRAPSSRSTSSQRRNALRLDLLDGDEEESLEEEEDDDGAFATPDDRRRTDRRSAFKSDTRRSTAPLPDPKEPNNRPPVSALSAALHSSPARPPPSSNSAVTSQLNSSAPPDSFATAATRRSTAPTHFSSAPVQITQRTAPTSIIASTASPSPLPSTSFDDYGHLLRGSSLREAGHPRLTAGRSEEDDEDFADFEGDVIDLEDEDRRRESSGDTDGPHPSSSPPAHPASSRAQPSSRPQRDPSHPPSSLPSAHSADSASVSSPPLQSADEEDEEHNDQQGEEADDVSSQVIDIAHAKSHQALRSFQSAPNLQPLALPLSPSPPSASAGPIPFSPPTSGGDDDYNDGNVMIVRRHHSPDFPQPTIGGTDEEDETDVPFTVDDDDGQQPVRPSSAAPPMLTSQSSPSLPLLADDGLVEAKQRREKIHEKAARRQAKSSARRELERLKRRDDAQSTAELEDDNIVLVTPDAPQRRLRAADDEEDAAERKVESDSTSDSDSTGDEEEGEDGEDGSADGYSAPSPRPSSRRPSGSRALLTLTGSQSSPYSSPASIQKSSAQSQSSASSGTASPRLALSRHYSPSPPSTGERQRREARHERRSSRQFPDRLSTQGDAPSADPPSEDTPSPQPPPSRRSRQKAVELPRASSKEREPSTVLPRASARKKKRRGSEDDIVYSDLVFEEKVGAGAYGDVYRGYLWGQEIAIKQIRLERGEDLDARVREFRREVKIMAKLRHPNVVEYLGACSTGHSLCLLTEYLGAGSLEDQLGRLRREGRRMRVQRVVGLAMDVVKGLNWLHHKGIIHRDLKSGNILIDSAGRAKLTDFGLSYVRRRRDDSMVGYHGVAGSPSYIAPEVLAGREYGGAADVYSFAVLLNEMLSGAVPYDDTPLADVDFDDFERRVIAGARPYAGAVRERGAAGAGAGVLEGGGRGEAAGGGAHEAAGEDR